VRKALLILALLSPLSAQAQEVGELVRFIACPIYRDTDSGKKSGCWLADDTASGTRYDISQSPYKPDWNFAVLVEGRVGSLDKSACGSVVLEPVRTSRLATPCTRHMLPAENYPGRKFVLPKRNIDPLAVPRKTPPGPYAARTFYVYFEFDKDFLVYQYDDYLIDQAVTWIRAAKPKKLVVTGFAATEPETVSGQTIAERPDLAKSRAAELAVTLRRLLPGLPVETKAQTKSKVIDEPDADGIPGQSQRRAEIRVVF
jgi:hypothetical protein